MGKTMDKNVKKRKEKLKDTQEKLRKERMQEILEKLYSIQPLL